MTDANQTPEASGGNGAQENGHGVGIANSVGTQEAAVAPAAKKAVKETVSELKSKIGELKKKAGDFDPKLVACWNQGERVPFLFLSLVFDLIANETGRIVITDIVCNMLRTVMYTTPDDLVAVVYLSANRIAPAHEGLELGIGDASIIKALAEACGRTEAKVKKQYKVKFLCAFWFVHRIFWLCKC